jgi:hypothetical protein
MNLFNFKHRKDFGDDWYAQFVNVKGWSLFQVSVSWNDYPSWPYLQIKSGSGSTLSILFWAYKFGLDLDILSHTWRWDYMDNLDEQNYE